MAQGFDLVAHEDLLTELADEITCNGGYRLEKVGGGRGKTSAATGQDGDDGRQPENGHVAHAQ